VPRAGTVLIATRDGVLADSLRFSLELEGFDALALAEMPGCLLLDQDVFERIVESGNERLLAGSAVPAVLLIEAMTQRLFGLINKAGIANIVEKPLLGRDLLDAIGDAIAGGGRFNLAESNRTGWLLPPFLRSSP
jgi:hypothetical protein